MLSDEIQIELDNTKNYFAELPLILTSMELFFPEGDSLSRPSRHKYYELTYVAYGELNYYIDGKKFNLKKGSTILVWPGVSHSYEVLEECEVACIYFTMDLAQNSKNEDSYDFIDRLIKAEKENRIADDEVLDTELATNKKTKDVDKEVKELKQIVLKEKDKYHIGSLVAEIIDENSKENFAKTPMLQALTLELLVQLNRALIEQLDEQRVINGGKLSELMHIAKEFIKNNYKEKLMLGDIADHVFLSVSYFSRAFKEHFKISPMNYLNQIRVEKSKELLLQSDWKINNIALEVGFNNAQRYCKVFKDFVCMTPSEYRKAKRL